MKIFVKIAWRNVTRNKYRSMITIMAVAFGLAALIFIRAFVEGGDRQMVENYTDLVTGHLQIHSAGFQKKMGLERSIPVPEEILGVIKKDADIVAVSGRVKDYVLVSSAEHSSGVLLIGVDPVNETKVTYLNKRTRKGEWLSEDKGGQIVLGRDLAEILNVDLGDKVIIMAQGSDGSLASGAYRLCGIIDSGAEEIDKGMALITLKDAQELLVLDKKISEFAIRTGSVYKSGSVSQRLKQNLNTSKFEVLTWEEISPITAQWLEFDRAFVNGILFVVLLVVASGIFNTILMSVLERIREFGIMLALGTKRSQAVLIVGLESAMLGFTGIIFGSALGTAVSLYFSHKGIDLARFATAFESYYTGSVIYPRLSAGYILLFSLIVLAVSIAVSVYPAWKAANLKPVDAIRHF